MPNTKKRLALFLDGTWNTISNNTNVWRLKALCETNNEQISYYSVGVGTKFGTMLVGGMFGYGLDQEVIKAYEWLIENYNDGDEIFLFGFSRGAFAARSLSGLISKCGLLQLGAPLGVNQLYGRYQLANNVRTIRELLRDQQNPNASFTAEERWILEYSTIVPIKFIGVWDTVGALGIPFGDIPIISRKNYQFLDTDLRINNKYAYQALAIDENRKAFEPTLWTRTIAKDSHPEDIPPPRTLKDVEQRWFIGAHSNIGGGYNSDLLAQIPLKWIMSKAISHGLKFRRNVIIDNGAYTAPITDSYAEFGFGLYRFVSSRYYRPIGCTPKNAAAPKICTNINETIDASVFARWRNDASYRPLNIVQWAKVNNIDITTIKQSVRADEPSQSVV
jgi:uncharacterized protein (DUF2235 family)